jgi:hypothetical protein
LEIAKKEVKQYLQHFVQYLQDDWEELLPTAKFSYNNNTHSATGVSPFEANYGFNPNFGGILSSEQCIPTVKARLSRLNEVQGEIKECLAAAQELMKTQFDWKVRTTPRWEVGDEVWLNSRQIATTRPSPKLEHRWLGPFPIIGKVSNSTYRLTLPDSMQKVHPVFHVSVLCKNTPDSIEGQYHPPPDPIEVEGQEEWEVDNILDCRRKVRGVKYLVSWKGFGKENDMWEPARNLNNCKELVAKFNKRHLEAASRHKRSRRRK